MDLKVGPCVRVFGGLKKSVQSKQNVRFGNAPDRYSILAMLKCPLKPVASVQCFRLKSPQAVTVGPTDKSLHHVP